MLNNVSTDRVIQLSSRLELAATALHPGDWASVGHFLANDNWPKLESCFWNASHPMPVPSQLAADRYLAVAQTAWKRAGLGLAAPQLALFKTTLTSTAAIDAALRMLARIYAGCNLAYRTPPTGFWRAIYALTARVYSESFADHAAKPALLNKIMQIWLMAWLNPMSLTPGRLPVAVRLVGILSRECSFTTVSPTHAGSGLAAGDLMSDGAPLPFARITTKWAPEAPLYVNAQEAAFAIRELANPTGQRGVHDAYDSLLQSARQVGLTTAETQDFVRRAMRKFGYSNNRSVVRTERHEEIQTVVGFVDVWSALLAQSSPITDQRKGAFVARTAEIENHSDDGVLLRHRLTEPLLRVESLIAIRGGDSEPWAVVAARWLLDGGADVLTGCEILCKYARPLIGRMGTEDASHEPIIAYQTADTTHVLQSREGSPDGGVTQIYINDEQWVIGPISAIGDDWQCRPVLDISPA